MNDDHQRTNLSYVTDDELLETDGDPWNYVWSMMLRKNHTIGQKAWWAGKWQEQLKPDAKERQRQSGGDRLSPKRKTGSGNVARTGPGRARDLAAAKFGVAGRTVEKAVSVIQKGCPQLQQAVKSGRLNVSLASKVVNWRSAKPRRS